MKNLNLTIALTLLSYLLGIVCGVTTLLFGLDDEGFAGGEEVVFAAFIFTLAILSEWVRACRYCSVFFLSVFLFSYLGGVQLFFIDWEEGITDQPTNSDFSGLSILALWVGAIVLVFAVRRLKKHVGSQ